MLRSLGYRALSRDLIKLEECMKENLLEIQLKNPKYKRDIGFNTPLIKNLYITQRKDYFLTEPS